MWIRTAVMEWMVTVLSLELIGSGFILDNVCPCLHFPICCSTQKDWRTITTSLTLWFGGCIMTFRRCVGVHGVYHWSTKTLWSRSLLFSGFTDEDRCFSLHPARNSLQVCGVLMNYNTCMIWSGRYFAPWAHCPLCCGDNSVFSCRGLHPVPDKEVIAMYEGCHVPLEIMSDFYGKVGDLMVMYI